MGFFVHLDEVASWFAEDTSPTYAKTQGQVSKSKTEFLLIRLGTPIQVNCAEVTPFMSQVRARVRSNAGPEDSLRG
jgi:hypothetical protein